MGTLDFNSQNKLAFITDDKPSRLRSLEFSELASCHLSFSRKQIISSPHSLSSVVFFMHVHNCIL